MNEAVDASKFRVLMVDDDQKFLTAAKLFLARFHDVVTCTSGEQALQTLQGSQFAVVVSDMHMPGMSGIEFIMAARELSPLATYMLLTGSRERQTAVEAFNEANVFCMIAKPCSLKDLDEFIRAAAQEYQRNCT